MALVETDTASLLYSKILEVYGGSDIDFITYLNTTLDNAFQQATPSLTNFDITVPSGTLNISTDNNYISPDILANEVYEYWSKAITPGTPVSCDNIDSVTNNADIVIEPIKSGLLQLYTNSANGIASDPPFYEFVKIIFDAIRLIEWTIEESDAECSQTHIGNVT